jgi:hypothetical protein
MILFDRVTKVYPNQMVALSGLNLHIQPKEFVTIVGSSGAGKSTLIKLITREETHSSGKIIVGGLDYDTIRPDVPLVRRRIGVVFQDFKLLPNRRVGENVAFALEVSGARGREIKRAVPKMLQLVGLAAKEQAFPTSSPVASASVSPSPARSSASPKSSSPTSPPATSTPRTPGKSSSSCSKLTALAPPSCSPPTTKKSSTRSSGASSPLTAAALSKTKSRAATPWKAANNAATLAHPGGRHAQLHAQPWLSTAATAVMTITLTFIVVLVHSNSALTSTIKGVTDKIDISIYLKTP